MNSDHSEEVVSEFHKWFADGRSMDEKDEALRELWDNTPVMGMKNSAGADRMLRRIKDRIGGGYKDRKILMRRRYITGIAAAVMLMFTLGGIMFSLYNTRDSVVADNIEVYIVAEDSVRYAVLPDSSKVWLNSNSSLIYKESRDGVRQVEMQGECLFDVNKIDGSLFEIAAGKLKIRVLGTEFCVKLANESTTVALYSGEVGVLLNNNLTKLNPDYILTYEHDLEMISIEKMLAKEKDWRYRSALNFDNVEVSQVLETVANYYRMNLEMRGNIRLTDRVTIRFEGNEDIEDVMFLLENLAGSFVSEVEGEKIIIYNKL